MSDQAFSAQERAAVYRVIAERRDMRHFSGGTVAPEVLARLLEAAHQAPSVGLMQPWRFVRITRPALRTAIHALVEAERVRTAQALGEREEEFMRLKVEGVRTSYNPANGPGLGLLRDPESLARRARRGPGYGLGVVVRACGAGRTVGHAERQRAYCRALPGASE